MKTYFLPVQLAKKDKQSSPFFGGKATKPHARTYPSAKGFALGLQGLKPGFAWFQTSR
jgi:hypothetical protein